MGSNIQENNHEHNHAHSNHKHSDEDYKKLINIIIFAEYMT